MVELEFYLFLALNIYFLINPTFDHFRKNTQILQSLFIFSYYLLSLFDNTNFPVEQYSKHTIYPRCNHKIWKY